MAFDMFTFGAELRGSFPTCNPIQKAKWLADGQQHGLSNRTLAAMLKIGE